MTIEYGKLRKKAIVMTLEPYDYHRYVIDCQWKFSSKLILSFQVKSLGKWIARGNI
jgi:hypothetical protein